MSGKTEVAISAIAHATEDACRIQGSCHAVIGGGGLRFDARQMEGHFGNPILLLSAEASGKEAEAVIGRVSAGLSDAERDDILGSLEERIDGGGLHIRLDKQELVGGRVIMGGRDAVKLRIRTPVYKKGDILSAYTKLLRPPPDRF